MQMPEAPAIIAGEVIQTRPTFAKSRGDERGEKDGGLRVAIFSDGFYGQRGATEVKMTSDQVASLRPQVGDRLALVVRFGMYAVEGNKGVTCELVAPVQEPAIQNVLDHSPLGAVAA